MQPQWIAVDEVKLEPFEKKRGFQFVWPPGESALVYSSDQKPQKIFINVPQSQFLSLTFEPDIFLYQTDEVSSSLDGKFTLLSIRKKKGVQKLHSKSNLRVLLKLTNGDKVINIPTTHYFNRHKLGKQNKRDAAQAALVEQMEPSRKLLKAEEPATVLGSLADLVSGKGLGSTELTLHSSESLGPRDKYARATDAVSRIVAMSGNKKFVLIPPSELRLEKLSGTGGQGLVFRTWWQDRPVAGKILTKQTMYQHEKEVATLMVPLDGPHLCRYLAACDELQMILMDWMDNGDLYSRIHDRENRHYVHWNRFGRKILIDIAAGVAFLHANNISHRDLKSPNVLLTHNWEAKISDFGSASISASESSQSRHGTLRWVSKEQLTQPCYDGTAGDVWSFGTVAWEVLTQQHPWAGLEDAVVREKIVSGEHLALDATWPNDIKALLKGAWAPAALRPKINEIQLLLAKTPEAVSIAGSVAGLAPPALGLTEALLNLSGALPVASNASVPTGRAALMASGGAERQLQLTSDVDRWAAAILSDVPDIRFDSTFGPALSATERFQHPLGVATNAQGQIYVTDTTQRVRILAPDGKLLSAFGSRGGGEGQFQEAYGIAVSRDLIAVADYALHCIHLFDPAGGFKKRIGKPGRGDGEFVRPCSVVFDHTSRLVVVDRGNNRVQIFAPDGTFVRKWGDWGTGDSQFVEPRSVALDREGNLVIGDRNFIRVFDTEGRLQRKFMISNSISFVHVAVDTANNVIISDKMTGTLKVYDTNGKLCTQIGSEGDGATQFKHPKGIAFDPATSRLVIADAANDRLQVLRVLRSLMSSMN